MKPSDSKAARAARKRKSRQGKKELAERERQHAVAVDKLDVCERIQIDQIVRDQAARTKAEMPAKIQAAIDKAVVKNARKDALKGALDISDSLTTVRQDSDGKIVRERMRDRHGEIIRAKEPTQFNPAFHSSPEEAEHQKQEKQHHLNALQTTDRDPARPAIGKPMNTWTMAELDAEKTFLRAKNTPGYSGGAFDYARPLGPEYWRPDWHRD